MSPGRWSAWIGGALPDRYVVGPWLELALLAAAYTAALVWLLGALAPGDRLVRTRRRLTAAAMRILMYRRSPRVIVHSELEVVRLNARYLVYLLPAVAAGGLLFAALYPVLEARYHHRPLAVGEPVVVAVVGPANGAPALTGAPDDIAIQARVDAPARGGAWHRVAGRRSGLLALGLGGAPPRLDGSDPVLNVASAGAPAVTRQRAGAAAVRIDYPVRETYGRRYVWLAYFLAVCLVAAGPLAARAGVRL